MVWLQKNLTKEFQIIKNRLVFTDFCVNSNQMLTRLFNYKDLLFVFILREFAVRYRQAVLGILWAVLQPLSMMFLFVFVFVYVLGYKVSEYPAHLFFLSGTIIWGFFNGAVGFGINSLTNHYHLITKIYFPREIIPISGVILYLIDLFISFIIFLIFILLSDVKLTLSFFWVPVLVVMLFVFSISLVLLFSALNVYYRDVKLLSGFVLQLWFFATPVFYSIDKVSMKMKLLLFLNPLTFIVENFRRITLEGKGIVLWQLVLVAGVIILFYIFCYNIFAKLEKRFADVI